MLPVLMDGEWHNAHPRALNTAAPRWLDGVGVAGVGGAESRMNIAKLETSDARSEVGEGPLDEKFSESSGN